MASRSSPSEPFDIDIFLNRFVPVPRFHYLASCISFFFGYRPPTGRQTPPKSLALHVWLTSFFGAFIGISIVSNVYLSLPPLSGHEVPTIIASFGAAAILEYNTIESPLSQPRNLIIGHALSSVIGVGVTKLFHLLPPQRFDELRWLAGALSVGLASLAMAMTKTVHPPAGATALLAATTQEVTVLGWWLPALIVLGCILMLVSAMLVNNLCGRRWPIYWWTAVDLKDDRERRRREKDYPETRIRNGDLEDIEKGERVARKNETNNNTTINKSINNELEGEHHNSSISGSDMTVTNNDEHDSSMP